jgi:hypothetical protein
MATHRSALEELAQLLLKKEVVERPEASGNPQSGEHRASQGKKQEVGDVRRTIGMSIASLRGHHEE